MDNKQGDGFFIMEDPFKDNIGIEKFLSLDDFKKIVMMIILGQRDNNIFMKGIPTCITTKSFQGTYDFSVQGLVRSRHKADQLDDVLSIISKEYNDVDQRVKEDDAGDSQN